MTKPSKEKYQEKYLMMLPFGCHSVCRTSEYQNEPERKNEALNFFFSCITFSNRRSSFLSISHSQQSFCVSKKKRAREKLKREGGANHFSKTNVVIFLLLLVQLKLSHDKNYTTSKLPPRKRKTRNKTLKT